MDVFRLNRDIAQLAVLQRIELADINLKRIRKLFGRYMFSNFFSKYFINVSTIGRNYYKLMRDEFETIQKYLNPGQNILSVGSGIGGLELIIAKEISNIKLNFVEKNYISKKIKYGWDDSNSEAYNSLHLLEKFLTLNSINKEIYKIFDFDKDVLPIKEFDIIISLYSLDFHYNFDLYKNYFKKNSNDKTLIIFDTIRPEYFKTIFDEINVIKSDENTLHKSKRIACRLFKN